jgi:ankyrin repeat protein
MNINDQLFAAAQLGNINLVINSLAQGADVDAVHNIGVTPLYIASQNGHLAVVELLLKKGADPEFKFPVNDMTPLCNSAYNGKAAVVQMLLDYGADIEAKIGSATVLHLAAQRGQREVVKLLLENGASLTPPAIIPTQEQTILEVLLQQGGNRLKTIGCYDGLSSEVFALEGIDYKKQNKVLMEKSVYRLEYIDEYTTDKKIPLITHQIYFTSKESPREIDDLSLNKMILSAKRLNDADSSWKHYIWTNNLEIIPKSFTNISNVVVKNIDEVQDSIQYNLLQKMLKESETDKALFAKISDLFRYITLNKFGGLYFDLDYEVYRADKLIELLKSFDFIGGKELDKYLSAIGNSFIASAPNHSILDEALRLLSRNLNQDIDRPDYIKYPCSNWHKTWFDSGPALISTAIYKSANNGTLDVILPSNVLYNVEYARYNAPGSRCYDSTKIVKTLDPETIGADMFCGSWSASEGFLNPIYYDKNIDSYLFEAASFGYTRIVEYFIEEKKANINALTGGATSLHIAVNNGHEDTVRYLLNHKANTEIKASNDLTALAIAIQNKHSSIAGLLIKYGADISIKFPSGASLLDVSIFLNDIKTISIIAENSPPVHLSQYQQAILGPQLFDAAKNGQTKVVETLLKSGANIEYATAGGHTPLYAAIHESKTETVEYLIKMGANITDNAHRFTPFFIASTLGINRNAALVQKQVHKIVKAGYDKVLAVFHKQPEPEGLKKTDYVFARYNEPIDRIKEELPKDNDVVFIYNKGEEITDALDHWKIEKVENKGLDPQAYLQHIVDNYDNFFARGVERVGLFQAMSDDHPAYFPLELYATNIISNCDNTIGKCEKTTIQTELNNMDQTIKTEGWKTFDGGKYANVVIREYSLERYINELICPFPKDMEYTINWGNQFAVDVDVIMRHPKEYYQRILDRMDIQFPAEVHFFERTNDLMFAPCPYERLDIDYAGEVAL